MVLENLRCPLTVTPFLLLGVTPFVLLNAFPLVMLSVSEASLSLCHAERSEASLEILRFAQNDKLGL